jgi:hypothetical protein
VIVRYEPSGCGSGSCSARGSGVVVWMIDWHAIAGGGMAVTHLPKSYLCSKCGGKLRADMRNHLYRHGKTRPLVER